MVEQIKELTVKSCKVSVKKSFEVGIYTALQTTTKNLLIGFDTFEY